MQDSALTNPPDTGEGAMADEAEFAAEAKAARPTARFDALFWLGIALSLLASLPALVAWTPQMTDYPSHLAGYKIMLDHGRKVAPAPLSGLDPPRS